ncbi:MAG: hypothetical protein ABIA11_03980 [Patescibacteria group bacterium]|nr:hypothetical protein [Patescibacteria group bacterium]
MGEQESLSQEHARMIVGSGVDPSAFAELREIYAGNDTALRQIRASELHGEYITALKSGDDKKRAELLQEAREQFPELYAWLSY